MQALQKQLAKAQAGLLTTRQDTLTPDMSSYYCVNGADDCAQGLIDNNVATQVAENYVVVKQVKDGLNITFVLMSGYMVFLMQNGFAMLTAGSVRTKNTKNVLLKNLLDACVGFMAYWLLGYAFAYGFPGNSFIGHGTWALSGVNAGGDYSFFFFQWTFAATAATIVSGSVAERTSFYAYLGYAFFLTAFVYPVVSHWVWDSAGWVSAFNSEGSPFKGGAVDFAGCSVVHMVGGFAGLCGAAVVGPRIGRFNDEGKVVPMPGHSATLCTLGTFILWFGWYGFNPGSALAVIGDPGDDGIVETITRCAVTTTVAAAAGGLTTLLIVKAKDHIFDLLAVLNGVLAGLVSITAACPVVEIYAALVIGIIGAGVYVASAMILLLLKIDDPLEAYPIHGGCGVWGCLAVGLFAKEPYMVAAGFGERAGGFYGGGGDLFLANLVTVLAVIAWTCALIAPFFFILKVAGLLRISPEDELVGNDVSKHGGAAYPEDGVEAAEGKAGAELRDYQADNMGVDDSIKQTAEEP
eukprot:CAMPEP_0185843932 /NCGR_PEP_ID=MMETSP1354-20130828/288_1 /TAXON_ID=708628 /ORGANISM="Erythrolobus madagascarensis, Strain CCMP3276" /LENGTH=521 /DNA_ID=CAMNT_0028543523 /DNA_START=21 /DNA_END=1586 /DNA_ORIENTATION=-